MDLRNPSYLIGFRKSQISVMVALFSTIIFILSLLGMAAILARKIPDLNKLPEKDFHFNFGSSVIKGMRSGLGKVPVVKNFSYELYLQKLLSRIRVLTMKTENKTGNWLERLRQRSCKKNQTSNDDYWDTLKKAKDDK